MADIDRTLIPLYRGMTEAANAVGPDERGIIKVAFPGRSVLKQAHIINALVLKHGATSLLDYGCGEAWAYERDKVHHWWRAHGPLTVDLFDPAIDRYSTKPTRKYDGVICSDVLEHIPEGELHPLLDDVMAYARKFVFFSICCRPAGKTFPDGTNVHVTLKEPEWWERHIKNRTPIDLKVRLEFTP